MVVPVVEDFLENEDENILYDLLINTEWPLEIEHQPRGSRARSSSSIITKAVTGLSDFIFHYVWYSPARSLLPPGLLHLVNKQMSWQIILASNGKLLAIVEDLCVEIRSARDDFSSVIGKCQVPKDPNPQWRRVAWSHDCTLLAYAESTGTVRVFDLMGSELFVIPPATSFSGDLSYAVAGLIFLEYKASAQWLAELLVINYRGQLKSYLVSVGTNQSYQESHSFSFSSHYSWGISSAIYLPSYRLLLIGGFESNEDGASKATSCGLTSWRVLSGSPYYKQVTSYEDDVCAAQRRKGLLRMVSFRFYGGRKREQDGIFKMSLSPKGTLLAAVHFSGRLSIWELPSLRLKREWTQDSQPGYDDINPEWRSSIEKRKKIKDKESFYPLIDVNWWEENAVILARCSGALTVSSVKSLRNLLGKCCEWFEPSPLVTAAHDGGFLSLECEIKLAQKRARLESCASTEEEWEDESDSDEESSAKARYWGYVKHGLYYITEMERFAPPRKRPRTISKNYRLVSLRSTTPEELYQRKIDHEEYGEALSLAQAYGLDTDLVYQRQWRKSVVNIASIQDYLSKIKKRSWVLHECVERVPENVDAAKELLLYGLKGTDLEALIAIGKGEDGGRFILPGDVDIDELPYDDFLSPVEEMERQKEREIKKKQELLKLLDFSKLTLEQKEVCRCRLKLLTYLDRLATYEEILGGPHAAEERYDAEFFKKFRNQNIVLSARNYAREGNVQALAILFTFHGSELCEHRLALLSNFPETCSPHEYAVLLPEAQYNSTGDLVNIPWHEKRHRERDFCEEPECRKIIEPNPLDEAAFLYEEEKKHLKYRTSNPTVELLADWYQNRAEEIESNSRQVDCALSLIRLSKERNIPGLDALCEDLITLETIVYEAQSDITLTLKEMQQMKDLDKLRLLMKNSSEERYVKNAYQWMIPFLHRCESRTPGLANLLLKEHLITMAKDDLSFPLKIFQNSKPNCQQKLISDQDQLMSIALDCIYSSERDNQLPLCYDILECLPQRGYGHETEMTRILHDKVDQLERHLSVSEVLEKHGLQKPISFVKNSECSIEEARQLMVRLTRHTGRKQPPVSEAHWRGLLKDMLDMQQNVYKCLEPDACYEIFTESLLCSSRLENIRLAGQLMHCCSGLSSLHASVTSRGKRPSKVNYEKSVELVLAAAREYFNSSTNLTDSCMELARCCLQLISDCPPVVQEELDLISAVSQLEEFGVKILPLQVRLRSDRLSLIKECISQCPTAYKQSGKLLVLADLLRVSGDDQPRRKGQVLMLLAEQALRCQDYRAANIHCQELMAAGYSDCWQVCSQLGESEGYQDLGTRQELMAFALTHCPPNVIQSLLASSSCLQTQVLCQAVNYQIQPAEGTDVTHSCHTVPPTYQQPFQGDNKTSISSSSDLLHRTTAKTMEMLSSTTTTTKAVLYAVSDAQWWKKSLTYLRPLQGQGLGEALKGMAGANADLERQGCHPFYESIIQNSVIDKSEVTYTSYHHNPLENFAEVLLRTGKLAETKSEGEVIFPATEVLLQLANDALPTDMTLAVAYLLALPQVIDADKFFQKQAHSALLLQLAAYYYALQIYARLVPCVKDSCHPLYRTDPKELITLVTKDIAAHATVDWPHDCILLIEQLLHYNECLTDLTQAQILQGLGKGVDVQRFAADSQYKRETILGLAETLEDSVFRISLSLAQRYNIPLWEIYMIHLEFLFTDSGLTTSDIEERIQLLDLFDTLKTNPESFYDHMIKYVYSSICGTDHSRLLYFYSLLEHCGCSEFVTHSIKPDTHVELLKKLKIVAPGLNYKKLTDEESNPLEVLEPVLTSQNVLSISKLAPKIPKKGGNMLTSSSVHAVWLQKLFWNGDPQLITEKPNTESQWLHVYDICAKYFDRLVPADLIGFIDNISFSLKAASMLTTDTRVEMTKKAIRAVKQIIEKPRKKVSEEDAQPAEYSLVSYEEALNHLQQSLAHLETLSHSFIVSLKKNHQEYGLLYDLSRSEKKKIHDLVVSLCVDGQSLDMIKQLLEISAMPLGISPKEVVKDAVNKVITSLSGTASDLPSNKDPLRVLEGIVTAVHSSVESGEKLVSSDDLLAWLRPFCGDPSLPVKPRIDVLQILEQVFNLSDEDNKLLVFFRTQAVLKTSWPEKQVEITDVDNEQKRYHLFLELLHSSTQETEFQHLALLLQAWPPMKSEALTRANGNPWVKLGAAMLSICPAEQKESRSKEVLKMCRSLYNTKHKLSAECVKQICCLLIDCSFLLPALKLFVESHDQDLHTLALEQIKVITKVDDMTCDTELLSLLLDAKLVAKCVSTVYYCHLIKCLLSQEEEEARWNVEEVAQQLQDAGYTIEAGSLLLSHRDTHPSLLTFSTALGIVKRWL
ncbi:neuroblastoma-amplified sequence [Protopterus annectens]|uniref:neuroblastoma-amplified sequence n=1 Tax=Protopterus annectens TaxID=7888 RepID=UPI001CFA29CF|nr:neuroblastoma-amplified sequence [Protopterus annectens]